MNPLPALQTGCITFGCLNNFCKVSASSLTTWIGLLQALPDARLLLHAHAGTQPPEDQKAPVLPAIQDLRGSTLGDQLRQGGVRLHGQGGAGHAAKSPGRHAHDCHRVPIDGGLAADHIGIAVESFLPEVIAQNKHGIAIEDFAFAAQEEPAADGCTPSASKRLPLT